MAALFLSGTLFCSITLTFQDPKFCRVESILTEKFLATHFFRNYTVSYVLMFVHSAMHTCHICVECMPYSTVLRRETVNSTF